MLSSMRAFARSPWAIGLFALLVLALGLTFNDAFGGVQGGGFVSSGARSVGARDISRELDRYIDQQRVDSGVNLTQREAAEQGVPQQIIEDLAQQTLLLAYGDRIGVVASTQAVTDIIAEAPRFKDALGQVSMEEVAKFANEQGLRDVAEFEAQLRDSITQGYIRDSLFAGLAAPQILSRPLTAYLGEQRTLTLARLTPASLPAYRPPTDEQLAAFYAERSDAFRLPELRQVTVLSYSAEDFKDKVSFTDAEIAKEYEARKREFSTPETRTITEFSSPNRNAIQDVIDRTAQGAKLEDVAVQVPGVTLAQRTVVRADITNKPYGDAIFTLAKQASLGPVDIDGVFFGVRVDEIVEGIPTPLAEVQERIREEMTQDAAQRLYDQSDETFYDLVQDGATLEEISEQIGAPFISYSGMDASGRIPGVAEPTALASNQDLLRGAFTLASGAIGDIVDANGVRSILRVDAIEPERVPALAEIRQNVEALYRDEQQREAAGKSVDAVMAAIAGGASFDKAAADARMAVITPPQPFLRANNRALDPAIMEGVFGLAQGVPTRVDDSNGEPWIVRVESIAPVGPEIEAQLGQQVREQVQQTLSVDLQQVFLQSVQRQVRVRRNDAAIQRYLDGFKDPAE